MLRISFKVKLIVSLIFFLAAFSDLVQAHPKKYQVITPQAKLHLEPDERSLVVAILPQGEILAQASAVKFKHNWIFVYYHSLEKDKTLAGYIREETVRRLFPEVNSIMISSGYNEAKPGELDLSQDYDFPYLWGSSQDKVVQAEGRPLNQEKSGEIEVLQYRKEIMNKSCLVEYIFWRNQLSSARFYLLDNYVDNNFYISDFLKVKNYLAERFGGPVNDRVIWLDSTYQNKQEFWGQALGSGLLEFRSSWVIGETEVQLILTGSDNKIAFLAECIGQKYKSSFSN
ncbi:MAG: hypothetical protein ACPLRA_03265 [Candidatus Saccharicenans sp.]